MASHTRFGWNSFIVRFFFALLVVFSSYNPEALSYYHWVSRDLASFDALKAFVGVIIIIGWVILIRATIRSLGALGIILAAAFFGLAIWLVIDVVGLSTDSFHVISYIILVMLASVLSIGVSWSHIRRRLTGQLDTDEIDEDM